MELGRTETVFNDAIRETHRRTLVVALAPTIMIKHKNNMNSNNNNNNSSNNNNKDEKQRLAQRR